MHAMLLLANAAGLAFVPHLRQLLDLAQGMLLSGAAADFSDSWQWRSAVLRARATSGSGRISSVRATQRRLPVPAAAFCAEEAYSLPGLLPAAGRLANASVALLGPDYAFGSRPDLVCKSIINDMRALELGGGRSRMQGGEAGGSACREGRWVGVQPHWGRQPCAGCCDTCVLDVVHSAASVLTLAGCTHFGPHCSWNAEHG